jgi:peptidoglycan/xylan/chitin deacetylase (PgdA/CDA1 family)
MKRLVKSVLKTAANLVDTPAVVLLYHRVTDLPLDPQQLAVSPDNFSTHLEVLRRDYRLLEIEEFNAIRKKGGKMPERSVVITFDDGYADNLHEAIPILERARAQALFYIATFRLDTLYEFWWDNLERIFLEERSLPAHLSFSVSDRQYSFDTTSVQRRMETYDALHPVVKNCNVVLREKIMGQLLSWAGLSSAGRTTHRHLTTDELQQISKSTSAVVGAHTHQHPKLSACSAKEQHEEIQRSVSILENTTGTAIRHFSYPFGTHDDYTNETVSICKSLNLNLVSANNYGTVHRWHSNFEIPRVLVRNWDEDMFKNQMKSFFKS